MCPTCHFATAAFQAEIRGFESHHPLCTEAPVFIDVLRPLSMMGRIKTITEKQELLAAVTAGLHQSVDGFLVAKRAEGLSAGTLRKIYGPLASRGN